jgi:hypothetical protein
LSETNTKSGNVIPSLRLSEAIEAWIVDSDIDNQVNSRNPLIARVGNQVGLGELTIQRLCARSHSLPDVVLVNPMWWTSQAKAKAIIGIALGL